MGEGSKVTVKRPILTVYRHRLEGVFIAKIVEVDDYVLCTKNMVPGEVVYNEKIISVENEDGTNVVEYRVWSPFNSTLAATIHTMQFGRDDNDIYIKPGARVLYLGAGLGTTVSHVSDIVGPNGLVYAVESSLTSGRDLANMAEKRTNVIPIIEEARHPKKYRNLVGMVDVICADIAEPDRARILALNAFYCLKDGGHFVTSTKASWERADSVKRSKELEALGLMQVIEFYLWFTLE